MLKTCIWSSHVPRRSIFSISKIFQPFDVVPHNQDSKPKAKEESRSANLLSSYGLVRQAGPGTFHLLPLGLRVQEKLISMIDREMSRIGCQKVAMPHQAPASLWKTSGRREAMGRELVVFNDRQGREVVLSPTHEEVVTSMVAGLGVVKGKQLPLKLYQVGTKFRDEMRPKFGLIRANEFTMKDLYTFDRDTASALVTYQEVTQAYRRLFTRLGVPYSVVEGDTGVMGGSSSHEFHFPSEVGQDRLLVCGQCDAGYNEEAVEENTEVCPRCGGVLEQKKGIEVGHTFLLGPKYSHAFGAVFRPDEGGKNTVFQMGCYGIGVTRVMAACVEVLSSQTELRWPPHIAPFTLAILPPKPGSREEVEAGGMVEQLVGRVDKLLGGDVVLDDRPKVTVGGKLRDARKTGYPYILLFGKQSRGADPKLELHCINKNIMLELSPGELMEYLTDIKNNMDL